MALNKYRTNTLTALIILTANVITLIITQSHTVDNYINIAIPIVAFGFIFFTKKKNIYLFYTIVGCLITFFGSIGNSTGTIFFFISAYDHRTERNIYINITLAIISFSAKAYINNYATYDVFAIIAAFFFIIGHLYVRFWPIADIRKHKEILPKGFTIEQADTIKTLLMDLRHQGSADELRIGRKAYTARVGALRDRYNVTTDFMLALKLVDDGIININDLANAKTQQKKL